MASGGQFNVPLHRAFIRASVALALTSVLCFPTSASGQSPETTPHSTGAVSKSESRSAQDTVAAQDSKRKDQQSEIDALKRENLALQELLRKIEEQQRILLEQVDRLQRRVDGGVATDLSIVGQANQPSPTADV